MRALTLAAALTLASVTIGRAAEAQEMPQFHAGEWAAEFSGRDVVTAGVMRFFNPQSAFVFNFGGSWISQRTTPDAPNNPTKLSTQQLATAFGVRRHRAVAPRVLSYSELGAELGVYHAHQTQYDAFGNRLTTNTTGESYGLYGELGGQYFIAPHLALGVAGALHADANHNRARPAVNGIGMVGNGFAISTSLTPIRLTLYF